MPSYEPRKKTHKSVFGEGGYLAKIRQVRAIGTYSDIGLHVGVVDLVVPTVQVE